MLYGLLEKEWGVCEIELRRRYRENSLAYHNLDHIKDCLKKLQSVDSCQDRDALHLAIWYHDVIYNPQRTDNEEASARFAIEHLGATSLPPTTVEKVARLVRVTDHKTHPETPDEKLIVDIDLSVLGANPEDYRSYAAKIREEYGFVEETAYREGRTNLLKKILGRPVIYQTIHLRRLWEEQARTNMESEIRRLARSEAE